MPMETRIRGGKSLKNALRTLFLSALVSFGVPLTSFAAGSFSGVIQSVRVNYGLGDILFVWVTGGAVRSVARPAAVGAPIISSPWI
jgi:hypothetical protein